MSRVANLDDLVIVEAEAVFPLDKHLDCEWIRIPASHPVRIDHAVVPRYQAAFGKEIFGDHDDGFTGRTCVEVSSFKMVGPFNECVDVHVNGRVGSNVSDLKLVFFVIGFDVPIHVFGIYLPLKQFAVQSVYLKGLPKRNSGGYQCKKSYCSIDPVGDGSAFHDSSFPCCVGLLFVALSLALRGKGLTAPHACKEVA